MYLTYIGIYVDIIRPRKDDRVTEIFTYFPFAAFRADLALFALPKPICSARLSVRNELAFEKSTFFEKSNTSFQIHLDGARVQLSVRINQQYINCVL